MSELVIENGIVIDDVEAVVEGIERISGKNLSSLGTVKKFITNEKSTKFYVDSRAACKMQPDRESVYLWLDTGYTDTFGNPVMISLLKDGSVYSGHFSGTMNGLSGYIRDYFPGNRKEISRNMGYLKEKYASKVKKRVHPHIEDENEYLVQMCNGEKEPGIMSRLIEELHLEGMEESVTEEPEEEPVKEDSCEMNSQEKEITFGLLFEKIEGMQNYIDELLAEIEKFNSEDRVRIAELEAKNREYKRAIVQMRCFIDSERGKKPEPAEKGGHALLENSGKVLVFGASALDQNTMNGIVKSFGFQKNDFEYETDYTKIKSSAGRIEKGEKYAAIIFGACPHKVSRLGKWSSLIEKCRESEEMPVAFDARSHSGELKVTKESFKSALAELCHELESEKKEADTVEI